MKKYLVRLLALIMLVTSLPLTSFAKKETKPPRIGTYAIEDREAETDGSKVQNTEWPVYPMEIIDNYSGSMDKGTGTTSIKYIETGKDDVGEYIDFRITQVGTISKPLDINYNNLKQGNASIWYNQARWSHLVLHFEKALFENMDIENSYIEGNNSRFLLKESKMGNYNNPDNYNDHDNYNTDNRSASIPMLSIFDYGNSWESQNAKFRLYLNKNHNLEKNYRYLIEYRIAGIANDTQKKYFRRYNIGFEGGKDKFKPPSYLTLTGNTTFKYNSDNKFKKLDYAGDGDELVSGSGTHIYIDWLTNELHVDYFYETRKNMASSQIEFFQLFPEKFKNILVEKEGNYGRFTHIDKGGYVKADMPITSNDMSLNRNTNQFGYRISEITKDSQDFNHPWKEMKRKNHKADDKGGLGRYYGLSISYGPIVNSTVYYIDPDKVRKEFENLDDLTVQSFFLEQKKPNQGVIKNSISIESPAYTKSVTQAPLVNDIYTDSKEVTGDTGYREATDKLKITVKNSKNVSIDPQASNQNGTFTISTKVVNNDNNSPFIGMQKDDKLYFSTIYQYKNYYRSAPSVKKVKARIHFKDYYGKGGDRDIDVPQSDLFRGQDGYKETGLGEKMPENPTKEGYIFKGWTTKPTKPEDYYEKVKESDGNFKDKDKLSVLDGINKWSEDKSYKFTKDSPINKSYTVYPVWEKEPTSIKIILHSNMPSKEKREIEIPFEENLPTIDEMNEIDSMDAQYDYLRKEGFSVKSVLPDAYGSKGIFGEKEEGGQKYNLVGWSTNEDNNGELIENLYSNLGMIAVKGEGEDREYYLSKVETQKQGLGQAAAGKKFVKISPDVKNEIHLYAAWKPYFTINVTKTWFDITKDDKWNKKSLKDVLQSIAHGTDKPKETPGISKPIQIGLLYRTAVTEASAPTVTDQANYYLVEHSLKPLNKGETTLTWSEPSYDAYGKRLSYIAVEFEQGQSGKDKYEGFRQKWTNIWTSVSDNVTVKPKPGEEFTDKTISKVQTLVVKDGSKIDAFSGATVRKLDDDNTVGKVPTYNTNLYNIMTSLIHPSFKKIVDGDKEIRLYKSADTRIKYAEFDLPDETNRLIFEKTDSGWERIKSTETTKFSSKGNFEPLSKEEKKDNKYQFIEEGDEWVLKLDLSKEHNKEDAYLKLNQKIRAMYYGSTQSVRSDISVETVIKKPKTPSLEGLQQSRLENIDGIDYVVVRSSIPKTELGQFQESAVLTIFPALTEDGEELNNAYKALNSKKTLDEKNKVIATREGEEFVFRIPYRNSDGSILNNLKDGDSVSVYGHQDGYIDSKTKLPLKLDLKAPVVDAKDISIYRTEDVDISKVILTNEDSKLLGNENLPDGLELIKEDNTDLSRKWKLQGSTETEAGEKEVTLKIEDKFGNVGETNWKVEVKQRRSSKMLKASQVPNEVNEDYTMYSYKVQISNLEPGATVKIYRDKLKDDPDNVIFEDKIPLNINGSYDLVIPTNKLNTMKDNKIYLTQTAKDKYESDFTEVEMDVIPPSSLTIDSKEPGTNKIVLGNISSDTERIFIKIGDKSGYLNKNKDGTWTKYVGNSQGDNISVNENAKLDLSLGFKLQPFDMINIKCLDKFLNPKSLVTSVNDFIDPEPPTIEASNENEFYTLIKGETKYNDAIINIYKVTKKDNPEEGEDPNIYTLIGITKPSEGKYSFYTVPKAKVGDTFATSVVLNGKESYKEQKTVIENTNIIPFDPSDDSDPNKDKPNINYLTIKLDANGGEFVKGTKTGFHILKSYKVKPSDFDSAKLGLKVPLRNTFKAWAEKVGLNSYTDIPQEGKTFAEDTTIYATYNILGFDKESIEKIRVEGPEKASYREGQKLDLTNLKVVAIDKLGNVREYILEDKKLKAGDDILDAIIKLNGETIDLDNLPKLTKDDHNGKPIVVNYKNNDYSSTVKLTVNKGLTQPVIHEIRENDKEITIDKPEEKDNIKTIEVIDKNKTVITLVKENGIWKVQGKTPETIVSETDGKLKIPVDSLELKSGEQIEIIFKDGENPVNMASNKAVVKKSSKAPDVKQVYTGDTELIISDPTIADPKAKTITIKVGENETITVTKDNDGNWKTNDSKEAKVEDGKIIVPLNKKAEKDNTITVTTTNDSNKESEPTSITVVDRNASTKPTIEKAEKDTNTVSGTAEKGAKVQVKVTDRDGHEKTYHGQANDEGNYTITTDSLKDGDKIVAIASENGKTDSQSDPLTIKPNTEELQTSIKKANDIAGENGEKLDPDNKPRDKKLKEALDNAKIVKEEGDKGNKTQEEVDNAKKALDDAIAIKEAEDAVKDLEDKIIKNDSDNPVTVKDLKKAQDLIDKVPEGKDKKDLQDRKDLVEIIKKGEDRLKEKDIVEDTKPDNQVNDLKEGIKKGKKIIRGADTTSDKAETIDEIKQAIKILDQEAIAVGLETYRTGDKSLDIITSLPDVRVVVMINGVVIEEKIDEDTSTDSIVTNNLRRYKFSLETELNKNDRILLKATKEGYNPGVWRALVR